ncbi:MAG: UvrD-helicase domain-containing protein [Vicinamibacterales bacterium]
MTRLADAADRALIADALDQTLVVEAAAGTGKTTELVKRIVRLVETGRAAIDAIVAVTFSEKAAGELKLRLREQLEHARSAASGETAGRLALAVQRFEESHVSTIHGFCADLLRERPVEARIDPSFAVLTEGQASQLFDEAFADWLQRELDDPCEGVRRSLRRVSTRRFGQDEDDDAPIARLKRAGRELLEWRDHPAPWTRPEGFTRQADIDHLLDGIATLSAATEAPISPRDPLARALEPLRRAWHEIRPLRERGQPDYDGWEALLCALANDERDLRAGRRTSGQFSRHVSNADVIAARDALVDRIVAFRNAADADLAALVHEALGDAVRLYEQRKTRAGAVDFLDLLIRARDLVRDDGEVRRDFQQRFRYLLVDEFQDTDPLQAELLMRLASDGEAGAGAPFVDLHVRPGALFIVGDPKQSIYRFRRADVGVYRDICEALVLQGATRVRLRTSFRSVPAIQRAVNRAFAVHMTGDRASLQAEYVELQPAREDCALQPAVVALPVPRPLSDRGNVTQAAIAASLPAAVGEFVRWLVRDSGYTVPDEHAAPDAGGAVPRRPIRAGDVCLLFRRFLDFQTDVTRDYVDALESRGLSHLLVGGKAFHEREEVDALRTALTAIEWPDDALSVFATLRGPFFAVPEEELFAWHGRGYGFRPHDVPEDAPAELAAVAAALSTLAELNRLRNHRTVADTIGRLLEATRAHAGFVLWRGGEQVLANVLQIAELARRYEAGGGLSFRGFVDELREAADRAPAPEAPIVEEGTDGVRLMTVHKAKGLEFPVVILADIGCRMSRDDASRYLDTARGLAAIRLAGWTPLDLRDHNHVEAARDRAEGVRLAYVAATRARDLLVVPAIGDGPEEKHWTWPLAAAIFGGDATAAPGLPAFTGRDTHLDRPPANTPTLHTMRPGAYAHVDPATSEPYTVVWWDPQHLDKAGAERRGLRHEHLIHKDAPVHVVAADRQRYDRWRAWRQASLDSGGVPSVRVMTATEWAAASLLGTVPTPPPVLDAAGRVTVQDARGGGAEEAVGAVGPGAPVASGGRRSAGARYGTLVHALLAHVPLDAGAADIARLASVQARLLGAPDEERAAAAEAAGRALGHAVFARVRAASAAGRLARRELPLTVAAGEVMVDGQADLVWDDGDRLVVADYKTDVDLAPGEASYRRQIALYADALGRAYGRPVDAVLLRV